MIQPGPFPRLGYVVHSRHRYYDPIRRHAGSMRLPVWPVIRTGCSWQPSARAGEGLPSSRAYYLSMPIPLPRGVPRRLRFQVFDAFHGLRRDFSGSPLPCPLAGLASRGCRIRLMLRPGQLLPLKGFRRWATKPGVSPRPRQPATGPPGSYPDRTFTGKQTRACRRGSPQPHHLLSEMTGAHVSWARENGTRSGSVSANECPGRGRHQARSLASPALIALFGAHLPPGSEISE